MEPSRLPIPNPEFVRPEENQPFLRAGRDFVDEERIHELLRVGSAPDAHAVRDIIAKAHAPQRLEPHETACLLRIQDADLWREVFDAALMVKQKVYGPRIVTFAPLYLSNLCVNSCAYCGFRAQNDQAVRTRLDLDQVQRETEALIALGHKRLIVVYGEHPDSGIDYMLGTIERIYQSRHGRGEIRRVNVNAAPQTIDAYRRLKEVGIGTYQVFQETYHHATYRLVHRRGPKADYGWRLYALHRAQAAGLDDVAIGALFGLYDWRFEVLGLMLHAIDLEEHFGGVGPHTISFPRINPAVGAPLSLIRPHQVSDEDFLRLVAVLRLSVPYTGLIVTAREPAHIRGRAIDLGCTQTDGSTRIGIGSYGRTYDQQETERQQFLIGDPRSLEDLVRELAQKDYLTSFCTAGYRCGRTGERFMSLAKQGHVHRFCVPNAILTMKEYLIDHASPETRAIGEALIARHTARLPAHTRVLVDDLLLRIEHGERDLYL